MHVNDFSVNGYRVEFLLRRYHCNCSRLPVENFPPDGNIPEIQRSINDVPKKHVRGEILDNFKINHKRVGRPCEQ